MKQDAKDAMKIQFDPQELAEQIAPYGNVDSGLRSSRPKNKSGLAQYVWRMARFHSGADTHMPMTCQFWLKDWLKQECYIADVPGWDDPDRGDVLRRNHEIQRQVERQLDDVVDQVLEILGEDSMAAARRWSGVL